MGIEADNLLSVFDTLNEEDIWQYRYPDDYDINRVGVKGIYLGNYIRWDPKAQHELMISLYNYKTASFNRTFDCYDYVDCFNYMSIHDLLKLYKHGFSKVTDHASREIRHGRITREQGLSLVIKHELEPPKYLNLFQEWLNIKPESLVFLLNQHRNPKFWTAIEPIKWSYNGLSSYLKPSISKVRNTFQATNDLEYGKGQNYITMGKGWP
jgi:hypothetical protein